MRNTSKGARLADASDHVIGPRAYQAWIGRARDFLTPPQEVRALRGSPFSHRHPCER